MDKKNNSKILVIILFALLFIFFGYSLSIKYNNVQPPASTQLGEPTTNYQLITNFPTPTIIREKAKVAFAVDGDTIELTDKRRVRYIGINTPEMNFGKGKPACFAADASKVNKEMIAGQEIEMEKDVSDKDKYARLLRYVYIDGLLINDFLLRQGYARLEQIPPDTHLYLQFKEAVNEAKENKRGLWGKCGK